MGSQLICLKRQKRGVLVEGSLLSCVCTELGYGSLLWGRYEGPPATTSQATAPITTVFYAAAPRWESLIL